MRALHEPAESDSDADRVEKTWDSRRKKLEELSFAECSVRPSASVIRCTPTCLSFLTARCRISIRNSLHADVSVFSDGTMSHQHP